MGGGLSPDRHHSQFSTLNSQTEYEAAVRQAQKYIQAGDLFQAQREWHESLQKAQAQLAALPIVMGSN